MLNKKILKMVLPFTLQQLRVLKAISKEKSFTKASKLLFLSQPSVSKQVKILEDNLGIILIKKSRSQVILTENGKLFLNYAERILALCEESCRCLNELRDTNNGLLVIETTQNIGSYFLPKVLTLFIHKYPQIKFQIKINSNRLIIKNLLSKIVDIGIVESQISQQFNEELKVKNLIEEEFILIISKFHPLAKKKKRFLSKEELYHLNFITLNSDSTTQILINQMLLKNNINITRLNILMQLNSIEAIKTSVSAGLCVAFLPSFAVEKEIKYKEIKIMPIKDIKITRPIMFLTNKTTKLKKEIKYFYSELLSLKI